MIAYWLLVVITLRSVPSRHPNSSWTNSGAEHRLASSPPVSCCITGSHLLVLHTALSWCWVEARVYSRHHDKKLDDMPMHHLHLPLHTSYSRTAATTSTTTHQPPNHLPTNHQAPPYPLPQEHRENVKSAADQMVARGTQRSCSEQRLSATVVVVIQHY